MLFVTEKQRIYAPKFASANVPDSHYSKKTHTHMHAVSLSQMLFQVITSYCHFCDKILCPCLLSLKFHCLSFLVLKENEVIISRSSSSLPHYTFPTEHSAKKPPTNFPRCFVEFIKLYVFINYCIRPVVLTV